MLSRFGLATALLITVASHGAEAVAEPLYIASKFRILTEGGSEIELEPGYYLSEYDWNVLNLEFKRLEEQEIRLTAENKSYKASAQESNLGKVLGVTLGAFALGITIGFAID